MKSNVFCVTSSLLFGLLMSFGAEEAQSFQLTTGVDRASFIEMTGIDDFVPPSPETHYETLVDGSGQSSSVQDPRLITLIRTGEDTGGKYLLAEANQPPESGPPLHVHSRETEWFYITEGKFSFQIDNQSFTANPGDLVSSVPGEAHKWKNTGGTPGKFYLVTKPAGFENVFRKTSVDALSSSPIPHDLQVEAATSEAGLKFPNDTTAVPEPSDSFGVLAAGALGTISILKRKRKSRFLTTIPQRLMKPRLTVK